MNEIKIVFYAPSEFEIATEVKCRISPDIIDLLEETLPITRAVGAVKASNNFFDYCQQYVNGIEIEEPDDEFYEIENDEQLRNLYTQEIAKLFNQTDTYLFNLDSLTLRQPDGAVFLLPRWKKLDGIKIYAEESFSETDENNLSHFSQIIDFFSKNPFFKIEKAKKNYESNIDFNEQLNLAEFLNDSQSEELYLFSKTEVNSHIKIRRYETEIVFEIHLGSDSTLYKKTQEEIKRFFKEFATLLPNFLFGKISDTSLFNRYLPMSDIKLPSDVSNALGRNLAWYNLLSRQYYRKFFTKEELLKIPTFEVEEFADGKIGLLNYPDPYGIRSYGSRQYIFQSLKYLRDILKDEVY